MVAGKSSLRLPGTVPGAHRRNTIVLLEYLLLLALFGGLGYALVTGQA